MKSAGDARGFTLIELIAVIAMIAVIAAFALPRLDPFLPKRRLKSAARVLSGTITMAYGEAIAKNKTYRLYIDPSEDKYWITEVTKFESEDESSVIGLTLGTSFELLDYTEGGENIEEIAPSEPMFAPKSLPQGVHFSSVEIGGAARALGLKTKYIEFTPLGIASPAVIHLINDEEEEFTIAYDGVTGIPSLVPQGDFPDKQIG
jgi:prepilin-type N-terminal cleavage/methylation domain-containing protein